MKLKIVSFYIVIVFSLLIFSCDKIDEPYLIKLDKNTPDPTEETRKVLLEEFTGQKCPNCPTGSKVAGDLSTVYGEQMVLVSIHAGFFSLPDQTGLYTADFRSEGGNAYNDYFQIQSYPSGMVNRKAYSGKLSLSKDEWEPAIIELLEEPAEAKITIKHEYNAQNRELDINTEVVFLTQLEGTYSVCIYIVENGIVSPQKNDNDDLGPSPDWEDYIHNHMLRLVVNGTWGEAVNNGNSIVENELYISSNKLTVNNQWNADNCHIVTYVYNNETKEIIQAEEVSIIE